MEGKMYMISLSSTRAEATLEELRVKAGLVPHIVSGVDGAKARARADPRLTRFCRLFATDRTIGCALAHHDCAQRILDDGHDHGLVVEDDVLVATKDLQGDISQCLSAAPAGWDFIQLFCQGVCSPRHRIWRGSTAAYLISRKGCRKVANMKIGYHLDWIRNSYRFRTVLGPRLFGTRDPRSAIIFGNQDLSFWMKQEIAQVGPYPMRVSHIIALMGASVSGMWMLRGAVDNDVLGNFCLLLLALFVSCVHFLHSETQFYLCSEVTHFFGLVFPALVVSLLWRSRSFLPRLTLFMAYTMFLFNALYALDGRTSESGSEPTDKA
jgi:hypothetical protein